MILNPLALLGPMLGRLLPTLAGSASSVAGSASAGATTGGMGGMLGSLGGLFGRGASSAGASGAKALSAAEIESFAYDVAIDSASSIFTMSDAETQAAHAPERRSESRLDPRTGGMETVVIDAAEESAKAARERRTASQPDLYEASDEGGSLFDTAAAAAVGGMIGSQVVGTAGALFNAPLQVANSIVPDGNLKNAAASGMSAAGGLGKAAWSGITMNPQGWVEGMTQFTVGVIEAAKQLKDFASTTAEDNRRLKEFSATVAIADAELQVGRLRREIDYAQETGGSAAATIRSQERLEDALKDLNQALGTMQNLLATGVNNVAEAGVGLAKLEPKIAILGDVLEKIEEAMGANDTSKLLNIFDQFQREAARSFRNGDRGGFGP